MHIIKVLVASSLAVATSASIVDTVKDTAQEVLGKLLPLTPAVQIPCCGGKNCPYCPHVVSKDTCPPLSISYPDARPLNYKGNPPGCGEEFTAEDCLRFFQVTLIGLDHPLGIAAKKAKPHDRKGDVIGCGEDSTAGDCLRYLKTFFEEVMGPLETTLGPGSLVDEDGTVTDSDATERGKSEL